MNTISLQLLNDTHKAEAIEVLVAAFAQDPVLAYLIPEQEQHKIQAIVFETILNYCQSHQFVFGAYREDETLAGVAAWLPPGADLEDWLGWLQSGMFRLLGSVPLGLWGRWLEFFSLSRLPAQPVWSLQLLGVSPRCQRQGIGKKLLQPILELSEKTGISCHLETSTESAVSFYRRQGFEVIDCQPIGKQGPPYWLMQTGIPTRSNGVKNLELSNS
ncbi:MAG: GNAT family N-acetyltransferase [Cyanobacteriota bacterium]